MFGKLFGKGKEKGERKTGRHKISFGLKTTIFNVVGLRSIPPMPGAAQTAFQLSTDPDAAARDFIDVIESDESLSARVMKIANSVYFDRGEGSKTIEHAVQVIGLQELKSLLNACSLTDIFPSRHSARQQLWVNDVATAITARTLAAKLLPGKEDFAFLAGLMHDIGKLLILQQAEVKYARVLTLVQQGVPFSNAEEEVFAFNHSEVGTLVAEKWRFDEELIEAIQGHHERIDPAQAKGELNISQIIQISDLICHTCGFGHPNGWGKFQSLSEEQLKELWPITGLNSDELENFIDSIKETVETELELYS